MTDEVEAARVAKEIGYPVPSSRLRPGGGGRGMKLPPAAQERSFRSHLRRHALKLARPQGDAGSHRKYLEKPRHIEVQVMGDGAGNAVHLGETRSARCNAVTQKVWEEGNPPRPQCGGRAKRSARSAPMPARSSAIAAQARIRNFSWKMENSYFIEVDHAPTGRNHPVAEAIAGIGILCMSRFALPQASGLSVKQKDIRFSGHAIECAYQCGRSADLRTVTRASSRIIIRRAGLAYASIPAFIPAIAFHPTMTA
ncbi:hypothetical protein VXQ18_15000 [Brucella abortus]|nr:hypothetical protein [Brucella abortus]